MFIRPISDNTKHTYNMKTTYFVIPASNIFNNDAFIEHCRRAFMSKSDAIDAASVLASKYGEDFFVCSIVSKVSCKIECIDTEK